VGIVHRDRARGRILFQRGGLFDHRASCEGDNDQEGEGAYDDQDQQGLEDVWEEVWEDKSQSRNTTHHHSWSLAVFLHPSGRGGQTTPGAPCFIEL